MRLPSILNAVHETPLVALPKLSARLDRHLFLKLESANPTGSMKDRVALHCIDKAIERKRIVPGDVIVESTSGCLGISLAMVGRHRGFHVICVIDPKTTTASRVLMRSFGAEVIEVSGADPYGNYLQARLNKVNEIVSTTERAWWFDQYSNPDHPDAHEYHTAPEILRDMDGDVDCVVCPVGTGGLVAGISRFFKRCLPRCRIMAVDAEGSVALGGRPGPRLQVGIGSGMRSKHVSLDLLDEKVYVSDAEAEGATHLLAEEETMLLGGSTGSALAGVIKTLHRTRSGERIVVVAPDLGLKYIDSLYCKNGHALTSSREVL